MGRRLPSVSVTHATMRDGEKIINLGSEVGGCLVSVKIVDGRLRIEVYRADDTVDVIAPASTGIHAAGSCAGRWGPVYASEGGEWRHVTGLPVTGRAGYPGGLLVPRGDVAGDCPTAL